jgi:hypothetical protein
MLTKPVRKQRVVRKQQRQCCLHVRERLHRLYLRYRSRFWQRIVHA